MTRIITSGILSFVFLVSMLPAPALAQTSTSADIQAQLNSIAALQAQLKALQEQMKSVQTQQKTAVAALTTQLRQGSKGDQVSVLQALLAADETIYPEGLITGFFGPATARAVMRYQKANGLEQVGFIGPKTLEKLKKHLENNPIAFDASSASSTNASDKRPCAIIPPGHLIAPGWLRKNGGVREVVPACQTIPPGIWDKLNGTSTNPGNDVTAPVLSLIVATPSVTSATITWVTNENSNSKVVYGTTVGYGATTTSGSMVTTHTMNLTGLTAGTVYHFQITSTDASLNAATSSDMTFTTNTVDSAAPILSAIVATPGITSASISWTTNEAATSQAVFGTTASYGSTTGNTSLTTAHTLNLSNLTTGTVYHFAVVSADSSGNTATSSDMTFTTGVVADVTAPVMSAIAVGALASTTATVTWSTNENATTKVYYSSAVPFVLGSALSATTAGLVTAHTQALTGLTASTTYSYVIESADTAGNTATTSAATFTTSN